MSDDGPPHFWSSLPGILTGIAAVITAIGGLVVALNQLGVFDRQKESPAVKTSKSDSAAQGNSRVSSARHEENGVNEFRVVEVLLRADPFNYDGPCPVTIRFSGRVSVAGGAGRVSYKLLRSDGASAPIQNIAFSESGSADVSSTWSLGGTGFSYSGWQAVKILDPSEKESAHAAFRIHCTN